MLINFPHLIYFLSTNRAFQMILHVHIKIPKVSITMLIVMSRTLMPFHCTVICESFITELTNNGFLFMFVFQMTCKIILSLLLHATWMKFEAWKFLFFFHCHQHKGNACHCSLYPFFHLGQSD